MRHLILQLVFGWCLCDGCLNASTTLFVAAKTTHLILLLQDKIESKNRVKKLILKMKSEGFGSCLNQRYFTRTSPKDVSLQKYYKKDEQDSWIITILPFNFT